MIAQNPDAYPSGQGAAAAERVNQRLAMGIQLLDNPDELARRIAAIRESGRFNPQLYAVSLRRSYTFAR